jgi:hypothetical protein
MLKKYSIIFISVFTLLLLVSTISYVNYHNASAQNSTSSSSNLNSTIPKGTGGIKIISPEKGSFVPINSNSSFIIKGMSKDNATADCKVSIIINGIKPYQPVQPMNAGGKEDYSTWQYSLSKNYTNFVLGSNKITAKSYCLPTQQSSYYSTNVTGMNFSPEQLKNYNSTNMSTTTTTNSTASNITSPTVAAGPHPIALEIQALKNSSSQMAVPTFVPADNTVSQALQGVTPVFSDTTSHASKDTKTDKQNTPVKHVKVVKQDTSTPQITTIKYVGPTDKQNTPVKHVKVVKPIDKHTTDTNNTPVFANSFVKEVKPTKHTNHVVKPTKHTTDTNNTPVFANSFVKEVKPTKHTNHVVKPTKHTTDTNNTPVFANSFVKEVKPTKHVKHLNPLNSVFNGFNSALKQDSPINNKLINNNKGSMNEDPSNNLAESIIAQVNQNLKDAGINMG